MLNNVKIILVTVGIIGFVSPLFYLAVKYNSEKSLNLQLNEVLNETLQEREQLKKYSLEIEEQLKEKENRLRQLSDVESIKNSLKNAQSFVDQLNKELAKVNNERQTLQNGNLDIKTRMENTNKEFTRTVEELKLAKEQISKLGGVQFETLKKKIEELSKGNEVKEQDLAKLKEDLTKLQQTNVSLINNNRDLEKELKALEIDKTSLEEKAKAYNKELVSGKVPIQEFQENINKLKNTLSQKEEQIRQLESELARLNSLPAKQGARGDKEQQKIIDNLNAENREFKQKISDLEGELNLAKNEANRLKTRKESPELNSLYESAREQISRLSELLVKKELEIDSVKKESLDAKEKMLSLQAKLSKLENELAINKTDRDRVKELERQRLTLDSRLSELQEAAAKKSELVDSLQKNLEYLSAQLSKKEEEIKSIEYSYVQVNTATREEFEKQKSRYEEINLLYNSLKTQVSQFADALNQKELELEQKRRELASLKLSSDNLEKDLIDAKERQRKTLDDLVAAVKLSTLLQERIMGTSASLPSPKPISAEQQKAQELKRKIEVILEPEK
jgi:chromosome segregation ATPase